MGSSSNTKIWKGTVRSNVDVYEEGILDVEVEEWGDRNVDVIYVSPYYTDRQGGIIAIPHPGAEVLITQIENSDKFYYAGSIVGRKSTSNLEVQGPGGYVSNEVLPEEASYTSRQIPEKVVIKTPKGQCITMSDEWDDKVNSMHIQVKTNMGKTLMMHDGPEVGAVILQNEAGDGLVIGGTHSDDYPTRGVSIRSKDSQTYQSASGEIDIIVSNGGELNIENNSNGANWLAPLFRQSGNVNISSKHRDINITNTSVLDLTKSPPVPSKAGSIYIHAGQGLQLECTEGEVVIHSAKKITIASDGDIDMQSMLGNININALAGDVNIKAGTGESGKVLPGSINMDSLKTQIHSEVIALNQAATAGMWNPLPKMIPGLLVMPLPTTPVIPVAPPPFPGVLMDANGDPYIVEPGI